MWPDTSTTFGNKTNQDYDSIFFVKEYLIVEIIKLLESRTIKVGNNDLLKKHKHISCYSLQLHALKSVYLCRNCAKNKSFKKNSGLL